MTLTLLCDAPASILPEDERLFAALGLQPYYQRPALQELHVGTVHFEETLVDVHVIPGPLTSWRFIVTNPVTREVTEVRTGSGPLTKFWGSIKLIASRHMQVHSTTLEKTLQTVAA